MGLRTQKIFTRYHQITCVARPGSFSPLFAMSFKKGTKDFLFQNTNRDNMDIVCNVPLKNCSSLTKTVFLYFLLSEGSFQLLSIFYGEFRS